LAYTQDYFTNRKYQQKQRLVERHVLEVLRWTTKKLGGNLLDGRGKSALDVGCAYGFTSHVLEDLGYETFGVDVSAWGTKNAKNLCEGEFLVCDAQTKMPFSHGEFDLVTCFDVLEHLPNPDRAISSMFDACRGAMVCTTPNKKVEKLVRTITRDYDETHINVKSVSDWKKIFSETITCADLNVEAFFDFPVQLGGKLFFKSFNVPAYGLTVRVAVRK
jgi:2-polyprenyl-3-methyl-5-hydroxy-6-metoxy-1,4-benzoquinol methylase